MDTTGKGCQIITGASKLSLGAIVPAVLEQTNKMVVITTTSDKFKFVEKAEFIDKEELNYPIFYVGENVKGLEELMAIMKEKNIRVAILNVKHKIFNEIVNSDDFSTFFSACRDGIFYYAPFLIQTNGNPKQIISFDNDTNMVNEAKKMCNGTNVSVCKAVAHSVCTSCEVNSEEKKINIESSDDCLFVFPPEASHLKCEICNDFHSFAKRSVIFFTESEEEFQYWILTKKIDINALHTLLCAYAYVLGIKSGLELGEIARMRFGEIVSLESIRPVIMDVHSLLYQKFLMDSAKKFGDNYELHSFRMLQFLEYLYNSNEEVVGRGIDIKNDAYKEKLADHISLLKICGKEEVITTLYELENILL